MTADKHDNQTDSPYVTIESTKSKSAQIQIDLTEYLRAFSAYTQSSTVENQEAYKTLHQHFRSKLTTYAGDVLFTQMMDAALKNLDVTQQNTIKQTPAYVYSRESFIEFLKNTVDETILKYYQTDDSVEPIAALTLDIDNTSHPDTIKISLYDNGRGFSPSFLAKMQDTDTRYKFMLGKGSPKQKTDTEAGFSLPRLFGGAGRGLRNSIARADTGCDLSDNETLKPHYVKPSVSLLTFSNHAKQGAMIVFETSQTPLKIVKLEEPSILPSTLDIKSLLQRKREESKQAHITPDENVPPSNK